MQLSKNAILKITLGLVLFMLTFTACKDDDEVIVEPDPIEVSDSDLVQESFFNASSLVSFETVACTLEDGTATECYQITFNANPVEQGPYCPSNIDETVSITIYDGPNNPGFQLVTRALFEAMELDGFDIVEDNGDVHNFDSPQNDDWDYCLGPTGVIQPTTLELTFLIPVTPVLATANSVISTTDFDLVGLSLDGIPIAGDPPSIYDGPGHNIPGGNIPALDPCGGHPDPAGYYHLHFFPETMNKVLDANGITEISCTNIGQASGTELIGFAKDGFPIYAYDDEPTDLDDCRGRTAVTPDFPNGVYHYVASNSLAPNAPDCIKGLAANDYFSYQ